MAWGPLRRLLGSTSLERKCRLLFGACLLLLIFASFWWYGTATERLVHQQSRNMGVFFVQLGIKNVHFVQWEADTEKQRLVKSTIEALEDLEYKHEFLTLDEVSGDSLAVPCSPEDRPILEELKTDYYAQLAAEKRRIHEAQSQPMGDTEIVGDSTPGDEDHIPGDELFKDIVPVYREVRVADKSQYHFFQPVYWKSNCTICHSDLKASVPDTLPTLPDEFEPSKSAANARAELLLEDVPFRVVKVVMQDTTQKAINFNRAVLLATAIITTFLAMLALYAVVRYVIIKPLTHLRSVSDEIASGNYSQRADLQTNDEFEDMAESFNRMLRHLVDSQAQLRATNDELDNRVDELAQVNMHLYETNRLKGDFLANMSHELRTPLNSIIGFSDVLEDFDTLTDQQKRYVTNIGKSGRVLLDLINDVLDLAKIESGKMEVRPSEFSVASIIGAQCDAMQPLSEEKNIDLDFQCPEGLPDMYTDQPKLQQIVTNLLSNAIKFTPEGGRISVTVNRVESKGTPHLSLAVEDTGVGIAEEERTIIFQKFRQAKASVGEDNLTREFSGTGLGLSIVRELCKLLGGEIAVESQLGQGSTFTITLPWSIPTHIVDVSRRLATVGSEPEESPTAPKRQSADSPIVTQTSSANLATQEESTT